MRTLLTIFLATGLLFAAAPYAKSDPDPDPASAQSDKTPVDKMAVAKDAETKGDLARLHKNYGLAAEFYAKALHFSRNDATLHNKLGIVELELGERGAATKNFSQAIKYNPQLVSALNNLGAVELMSRKYRPAVGYFKRVLAMDETSAPTHLNLAEAWMGLGEVDRAMTEYARALELDADVLSSSQEGVIAQVMTPQQRARVSYLIAKSYMKRGNPDGALDYLLRAKEEHYDSLHDVYKDPEFAPLWSDPRLANIIKR